MSGHKNAKPKSGKKSGKGGIHGPRATGASPAGLGGLPPKRSKSHE